LFVSEPTVLKKRFKELRIPVKKNVLEYGTDILLKFADQFKIPGDGIYVRDFSMEWGSVLDSRFHASNFSYRKLIAP
jgi:hypothetical protein